MIGYQKGGLYERRRIGHLISQPLYQQNARGLFSFLSKGIKFLSPLLKKGSSIASKAIKSAPVQNVLKNVGETASNIAVDAISDVISGEDPKINLETNIKEARKEIASTIKKQLKRKKTDFNETMIPTKRSRHRSRKKNTKKFRTIL